MSRVLGILCALMVFGCVSSKDGMEIRCEYQPGCMKGESLQVYWTLEIDEDGSGRLTSKRWNGSAWVFDDGGEIRLAAAKLRNLSHAVQHEGFFELENSYPPIGTGAAGQASDSFIITVRQGLMTHRVAVSDPAFLLEAAEYSGLAQDIRVFVRVLLRVMSVIPTPVLPDQTNQLVELLDEQQH